MSVMRIYVTARISYYETSYMFGSMFKSIDDAKIAIINDAILFLNAHKCKNPVTRQKRKWCTNMYCDYYEAYAQDGTKCIWQYHVIYGRPRFYKGGIQ